VIGFDIQPEAIDNTRRRLQAAGLAERVSLLHCGHERLANHLNGRVHTVMFNLGYLPGGDKALTTRPSTTLAALNASSSLLGRGASSR